MNCPKYIADALRKRATYASKFTDMDYLITEWLEKNHIEVENYDICGGCEAIVNPHDSIERIFKAIEEA